MPRRQGWLTLVSCMMAFALVGFFGKKEEAKKPPKQQQAVAPVAAPTEVEDVAVGAQITIQDQSGTVVHQFGDDESMRSFAAMWQQRRGVLTRVAVLRAYLTEEQARLQEMDSEFDSQYSLNTQQPVVLDSDRKVLIQLEASESDLTGFGGGS